MTQWDKTAQVQDFLDKISQFQIGVRVYILLTCEKPLHDRIISFREEVCATKFLVPSQQSEPSWLRYMC
jgi:hypothetical protein